MNKDNEKYKFHSPSWSHSLPQRQPPCLYLCIFQRQCGPTDMSLCVLVRTCVHTCVYTRVYTRVYMCTQSHTHALPLALHKNRHRLSTLLRISHFMACLANASLWSVSEAAR